MTNFDAIREKLIEMRGEGNFKSLDAVVTLVPLTLRIDSVSADGTQIAVRHADGTIESLTSEEVADVTLVE